MAEFRSDPRASMMARGLFRRTRARWRTRRACIHVDRVKQASEFGFSEAEQFKVEVRFTQCRKFRAQQALVPTGVLGNSVVGDDKRPPLRLGQMIKRDDRHLGHAEALRGQEPAVPGDDDVIAADQDRVDEAELRDRSCDLGDLLSVCVRAFWRTERALRSAAI